MKKSELRKIIKEEIKRLNEGTINEKSEGLLNFKKDLKGKIYVAHSTGEKFEVSWTDRTFDDGVPVIKYMDRNPNTYIKIPNGKSFYILESKSGTLYFELNDMWYRFDLQSYGTPPFDY